MQEYTATGWRQERTESRGREAEPIPFRPRQHSIRALDTQNQGTNVFLRPPPTRGARSVPVREQRYKEENISSSFSRGE